MSRSARGSGQAGWSPREKKLGPETEDFLSDIRQRGDEKRSARPTLSKLGEVIGRSRFGAA